MKKIVSLAGSIVLVCALVIFFQNCNGSRKSIQLEHSSDLSSSGQPPSPPQTWSVITADFLGATEVAVDLSQFLPSGNQVRVRAGSDGDPKPVPTATVYDPSGKILFLTLDGGVCNIRSTFDFNETLLTPYKLTSMGQNSNFLMVDLEAEKIVEAIFTFTLEYASSGTALEFKVAQFQISAPSSGQTAITFLNLICTAGTAVPPSPPLPSEVQ
jgi:hypothetical protein